MVLTNIW